MADIQDNLLKENEYIKELLEFFSKIDEKDMIKDLSNLVLYVDSMEMQFDKVLKELQEVKTQLAAVQKSPIKDTLVDMVKKVENKIQKAKEKLNSIKSRIIEGAAQKLENARQMGLIGINKITSFIGARQALETMGGNLKQAEKMMEKAIVKLGDAGQELRGVGRSISNAGRILAGKERQDISKPEQGRIASVILAPMRTTCNILSGMEKTVACAVGRLDHLEQNVANKISALQGMEEIDNIPLELSQCRKEYITHIENDFVEFKEYLKLYEDINGKSNTSFDALITAIHERMINLDGLTNSEIDALSKIERPLTAVHVRFTEDTLGNQINEDKINSTIHYLAKEQIDLSYYKCCSKELNNDMER